MTKNKQPGTPPIPAIHPQQSRDRFGLTVPLYLGFAATGVGVALPGAALPAMLQRWALSDAQGGRLFLFAWIGSSLGALAVQGSLRKTLIAGCALVTAGAALLAFGLHGAAQADASMLVYGLGLGLTMTSMSLTVQQSVAPSQTGTELIRLNLLWALGAFLCPGLAEHALAGGDLRPLLGGVAAAFAALGLWCAFRPVLSRFRVDTNSFTGWSQLCRVPLPLLLMTMLTTGVEASAGGWLATYANRTGHGIAGVVAAPTCLWAGLLLSRLFWSVQGNAEPARVMRISIAIIAGAAVLLVLRPESLIVAAGALCLGFGIGPVYPLLLDTVLRYTRGGPIFFLAGVGSACLPWLTGTFSTANGSLRIGLLVPTCASVLLLLLALASPLRRWAASQPAIPSAL